jgi:sulfatase maturation enzyme AslB (radical SAM superfamily)
MQEKTLSDGNRIVPDAVVDAGAQGAGGGLLLLLKHAMRGVGVGERLEINSSNRTIANDLRAWSRIAGHEFLGTTADGSFVLRRGGKPLSLSTATETLKELWLFPISPNWCNLACTHCLYTASPRSLDRYRVSGEELSSILAQLGSIGARPHFMITGGEPFLHPDLAELLGTLDAGGYSFQVMSNGTMISERVAERFSRFKHLRKIQISIEGESPELNDQIYGKGVFERAMTGIRRLRGADIPVAIAVTPMAENESRLPAIEKLAQQEGAEVKYILLYPLGAATENKIQPAQKDPPVEKGDGLLMCDKGVAYSEGAFYPCTILVKDPSARLGSTLAEALGEEARAQVGAIRKTTPACEVCKRGSS